jgi:hypothetical protein
MVLMVRMHASARRDEGCTKLKHCFMLLRARVCLFADHPGFAAKVMGAIHLHQATMVSMTSKAF